MILVIRHSESFLDNIPATDALVVTYEGVVMLILTV